MRALIWVIQALTTALFIIGATISWWLIRMPDPNPSMMDITAYRFMGWTMFINCVVFAVGIVHAMTKRTS